MKGELQMRISMAGELAVRCGYKWGIYILYIYHAGIGF